MPKAPKDKELLPKSEVFKTYKDKIDKILSWRHREVTKILSKDMTEKDLLLMQGVEDQTKKKLLDVDPSGKELYSFYPNYEKI